MISGFGRSAKRSLF